MGRGALALVALAWIAAGVACTMQLPTDEEFARTPTKEGTSPLDDDGGGEPFVPLPAADAATTLDASGTFVTCGDNGIPGDKSTLFRSENGVVSKVEECEKGCEWTKNAAKDRCRTQADCVAGSGLYCGDNGVSGDDTVLFRCGSGKITPSQRCPKGCERRPPDENDRCVRD